MSSLTVLCGDALEKLRELPDERVQCCVTSPPFWGLRDYGTAKWEGGDDGCDHSSAKIPIGNSPSNKSTLTTNNGKGPQSGDKFSAGSQFGYSQSCKFGAKRIDAQLGLEKTPEEYVAKMVEVFREVRRVLRKDGTLWLNLGDSYAASSTGSFNGGGFKDSSAINGTRDLSGVETSGQFDKLKASGLKPKDLVGIPWMVAFALRADGWWLRSDIIWAKPNPMPESVRDRPTKSHEYIFLLTKSARYFYDAAVIAERAEYYDPRIDNGFIPPQLERDQIGSPSRGGGPLNIRLPNHFKGSLLGRNGGPRQERRSTRNRTSPAVHGNLPGRDDGGRACNDASQLARNKRSVWRVATSPYPEAHFATYPPDLIKPCILAGSRVGDTILDPFAGSGTTGQVALELGRRAILIELNPKYVALIEKRCSVTLGLGLSSFARDAQTSTRDARAPRKVMAA